MASNIEHLARKFEAKLAPKVGARRGARMNARKLHREFDKARSAYKAYRGRLGGLESELSRMERDIQECRDGVRDSRSTMLKMNQVLQNMDLSDANYAVLYDNDAADVGYMIGGEEQYLDITEDGEINITPWREHRRNLRKQRAKVNETDDAEAYDYDNAEVPPSLGDEEDSDESSDDEDDDNDLDDDNFIMHPNFRFID